MANKSRFSVAESNIKNFFLKESGRRVFTGRQLSEIFEQRRIAWNLPATWTTAKKFIEKLLEREIIEELIIDFDGYIDRQQCFIVGNPSVYELATSLISRSYLSHYSAVFLNGLTNQVPKTVYITFEQSQKNFINRNLTQAAIDAAFAKPQRKATTRGVYKEYSLLVLNGMFSNHTGITQIDQIPVTNIERTLVDIAVRPGYAGGVFSVLDAYKQALTNISINKLIATLEKFNFIYPYHQAIGFYLEKAGLDEKRLDRLRKIERKFDFYLTYEMTDKEYSTDWRIYYPKGM